MNWFLTKISFQIFYGTGNHQPQFEEQLRLVAADDKKQAFEKAKILGMKEVELNEKLNQQLVRWKFINVFEVYRLCDNIDGAELHSHIKECNNGETYINMVDKKAFDILNSKTRELLQIV